MNRSGTHASETDAVRSFHIMSKPTGPICNLACQYCFYLEKENLYPGQSSWAMSDQVLESYVRQYIEAQDSPVITFAWQGGEPTLLGVEFFRKAVALQKTYADGKQIENTFQTNGILLDDEWGSFLAENQFLVGISIDGPRELHDCYRVNRGGEPTFDRVIDGIAVLRNHQVEFNTLTVVHRRNSYYPKEVYAFLKTLGSGGIQFIPVVERIAAQRPGDGLVLISPDSAGAARVTEWSVEPRQYGNFLCAVFDEWVRQDVSTIFVQVFDVAAQNWYGVAPGLCLFAETCGGAMALEHNGDLYSCDHYVYPKNKLGNIADQSLKTLVTSPQQRAFGLAKRDSLPRYCRECDVRFACHGECPKHRFLSTPDGESGLNYLCEGYKRFFHHIDPYMRFIALQLSRGLPPGNVMEWVRKQDLEALAGKCGRNEPCPCGSGKKFKRCCGAAA